METGGAAVTTSSAPARRIFCHAWLHQVLGKAAFMGSVYVIGMTAIQLALETKDKPPSE